MSHALIFQSSKQKGIKAMKVNNLIPANEPLTMSSREIAEVVQSRHDAVIRTIKRLERDGIIQPPMVENAEIKEEKSVGRSGVAYRLEKRDSLVVVAQLSPEFTARLVDRWQELEAQAAKPAMLSGPQLMAAALIEADATMKAQAIRGIAA